jgi:hypothetical protein
MAKGQQRSNREIKKPKAKPAPAAIPASSAPARAGVVPTARPKGKG